MIQHSKCPVCLSEAIRLHFPVKDAGVSGETFPVWHCENCNVMFTAEVPAEKDMGRYYASEAYVSHTDSRKGLINNLYHRVRRITLKKKRNWVEDATGFRSGKILDIGCGTGSFLSAMKKSGWDITGIEPDPTARENAGKIHGISALTPETLSQLNEGSFQAITMWHVLEHVHGLHDYLQQINKLLAAEGKLFIAVPNYTCFDAKYYRQHWAAWDVPKHLYHFSPESMDWLLKKHGFHIEGIKPMWFDSFYVSLLSEKHMKRPLGAIRAVGIGALSNLVALFSRNKCSSLVYVAAKN